MDETEIIDQAFPLIFAFDEIVALGYRENVNLAQIRTFTEMDSHEEKVFQAVRQVWPTIYSNNPGYAFNRVFLSISNICDQFFLHQYQRRVTHLDFRSSESTLAMYLLLI